MGHIIAVYGAHGGAGATTLAINLAVRLKRDNARILLMDMNLHQDDIHLFLYLDFPHHRKLDDLGLDINVDMLKRVTMTHDSGITVFATLRPPINDKIGLKNLGLLLDLIQSEYDLIVVDTGRYPNTATIEILRRAISVILIMQPTLPSMKNAGNALNWFTTESAFPVDKIVTVLSQVSDDPVRRKITIPADEIERYLRRKFDAQLPLDVLAALGAISNCVPIIQNPHSPSLLAQALDDFGRFIFDMLVYNNDEVPSDLSAALKLKRDTLVAQYTDTLSKDSKIYSYRPETITILIVDVNSTLRENIKKLLASETDMLVIGTAVNGREAFEMTRNLKPNIVIMDLDMHQIDGIEAIQRIVRFLMTTSVIALSSDLNAYILHRAMLAGAEAFLEKPISPDELWNTIRRVDNRRFLGAMGDPFYKETRKFEEELEQRIVLRPAPDKEAARKPRPTNLNHRPDHLNNIDSKISPTNDSNSVDDDID